MVGDEAKFLPHEAIFEALTEWAKRYSLFVPVEEEKGVFWRLFEPGIKVELGLRPLEPPKRLFFPPTEVLLRFSYKERQILPEIPKDDTPLLVFGIRPCDLHGLKVLDQVLGQQDPYWKKRFVRAVFVSQPCTGAYDTCFCTWVGINPKEAKGADVSLVELNGGWLLQPLTERGRSLLEVGILEKPSFSHLAEAQELLSRIEVQKGEDLNGLAENFYRSFDDLPFWRHMTFKCKACAICTFLCPTCFCFNITDEKGHEGVLRLRTWDSCMFFHYTLEASGHNPRPTKAERYRNRIGHKFCYHPERYTDYGCTGCGRCIKYCPVSLDVREVLRRIKRY